MRKRSKLLGKPLKDALSFLDAAGRLLRRLEWDSVYIPDEEDFYRLQAIETGCREIILLRHRVEFGLRWREGSGGGCTGPESDSP